MGLLVHTATDIIDSKSYSWLKPPLCRGVDLSTPADITSNICNDQSQRSVEQKALCLHSNNGGKRVNIIWWVPKMLKFNYLNISFIRIVVVVIFSNVIIKSHYFRHCLLMFK